MKSVKASQEIDLIITSYSNWKGELLAQLRAFITQTSPAISEEVKWKTPSRPEGLPVWSYNGILCLAEVWKDNVKLVFPKGVHINDPHKLFNARLKSATDRAIEFHEDDGINEAALKQLITEAMSGNASKVMKS